MQLEKRDHMDMKSTDSNQQFNITISEPHDKGVLTTKIGRKIESVSFGDLLAVALLALTISTEFFYIFTPLGHGLNTNQPWSINLALDSLYFSLITFTTLGYGDISPLGAGRVVAVILVLCGLIIMTLTIGKVASERQQSLLLLLHTSDCQRRIAGFIEDLENYLTSLRKVSGCTRYIKVDEVKNQLSGLKHLLEAIDNYVAFHLYQSKMIDFGNDTAMIMLLRKKEEVSDVLITTFRSGIADKVVCSRCLSLSKKLALFEALILEFQNQKQLSIHVGSGWRCSFKSFRNKFGLTKSKACIVRVAASPLKRKYETLREIAKKEPSELLFSQVEEVLLPGPRTQWPPHQDKRVAVELKISRKLAQSCIKTLIQRGVC